MEDGGKIMLESSGREQRLREEEDGGRRIVEEGRRRGGEKRGEKEEGGGGEKIICGFGKTFVGIEVLGLKMDRFLLDEVNYKRRLKILIIIVE